MIDPFIAGLILPTFIGLQLWLFYAMGFVIGALFWLLIKKFGDYSWE